jgi:hypothetical protein
MDVDGIVFESLLTMVSGTLPGAPVGAGEGEADGDADGVADGWDAGMVDAPPPQAASSSAIAAQAIGPNRILPQSIIIKRSSPNSFGRSKPLA